MIRSNLVTWLAAASFLGGCGLKGPLYLPPPAASAPTAVPPPAAQSAEKPPEKQ